MIPAEDGLERFRATGNGSNWLVIEPNSRRKAMRLTAATGMQAARVEGSAGN